MYLIGLGLPPPFLPELEAGCTPLCPAVHLPLKGGDRLGALSQSHLVFSCRVAPIPWLGVAVEASGQPLCDLPP